MLHEDGSSIASTDDLFTILNMAGRRLDAVTPPDATSFNAGFTPADNVYTRPVDFTLKVYNYVPEIIEHNKNCRS